MLTNKSIAIYVVHYSRLKERKVSLEKNLSIFSGKVFWVTEKDINLNYSLFSSKLNAFGVNFRLSSMDRSNNSRSIIKSRRVARIEGLLLFFASHIFPRGIGYLTDNSKPVREKQSILELTFMHIACLRQASGADNDWILVLEDDAIFDSKKIMNLLNQISNLNDTRPAWYNVSSGANLHRTKSDPKPDNLGFYRVRPYGTRCSSGYLINKKFISQALSLIDNHGVPDWTAIDIIYQILQRRMRAKVYWQEPAIVQQGSETGHFQSNFNHG